MASQANAGFLPEKFYVRADIGHGIAKEKLSSSLGDENLLHKSGHGTLGSIGIGVNLTPSFRSELQLYLDQGFKARNDSNAITKAHEKTSAAFINGIFDLSNSSKFTPHILGGVGYARSKFSTKDGPNLFKGATKKNFAWQTGVGVSYKISRNVDLDASYRLMDKGKSNYIARTAHINDYIKARVHRTHALMFGIKLHITPALCHFG